MEDDLIDPKTGKPRRHDGRDPWSFMTRAAVLAAADLGPFVPRISGDQPGPIAIGAYVQLVIVRERNDPQGRHEALWVEVLGAEGDDFVGALDNQPTWVRGLAAGDEVRFARAHVLAVRSP